MGLRYRPDDGPVPPERSSPGRPMPAQVMATWMRGWRAVRARHCGARTAGIVAVVLFEGVSACRVCGCHSRSLQLTGKWRYWAPAHLVRQRGRRPGAAPGSACAATARPAQAGAGGGCPSARPGRRIMKALRPQRERISALNLQFLNGW